MEDQDELNKDQDLTDSESLSLDEPDEPAETTKTISALHTMNIDLPERQHCGHCGPPPLSAGHRVSHMNVGLLLVVGLIVLAV